ncbi:MAG: AMP-binding protein [Bacteroidales bacterium]
MKENFIEFIGTSIKNNWDKQAFSDYKGSSYKYSDVAHRIARIHIAFEQGGIKRGDHIALLGKNSAHWTIVYLATISYGAVIVPILPDFKPKDVHHIVTHSDSKVLFVAENILETLKETEMAGLQAIFSISDFSLISHAGKSGLKEKLASIDDLFEKKYDGGFNTGNFTLAEVPNNDLAVISYTSGTTGFSKGVMLPHNSLIANIVYAHNNMPLQPGDAIVSFLPLAHSYGCAFEFLFPFTLGCHITFLTKTPSPQIILGAFKEIRPRLVLAVPLVIEKIYKKQLLPVLEKPSVKFMLKVPGINNLIYKKIHKKLTDAFGGNFHEVVIGGAALNKDVELFFNKIGFPFSIGYGMTECGPLISYANWDKTRLGSAGKMVDTLEVKIDSEDPYNEVGEIMVRGENVMTGYYKNEQATSDVLDKDGWLHTGDLGVIDKDDFVYIKGRSKSMLLGPSGQNIYPEEIEAKLNNMHYVLESVVIENKGRLVALVYPDHEAAKNAGIDDTNLEAIMENHRKDLNNELPVYMNLHKIRIYPEEFEKTPKKSIKRFLYMGEEE